MCERVACPVNATDIQAHCISGYVPCGKFAAPRVVDWQERNVIRFIHVWNGILPMPFR